METIEELKKQIEDLQDQVTRQEKLASLGMLTAGIMHEIRNPMNFIMNFSMMSGGLLDDLEEDLKDAEDKIDAEDLEDIREIMDDLHENLSKINEHGERATSIMQNILQYSRGKADMFIPSDVCALVKEYVWLGFHAMRANYQGFNVTIGEDYQENLPQLEVIPQDITRAVLNVLNNAYYAVWEKKQTLGDDYHPEVNVSVKKEGEELVIRIQDNGKGMSDEVKENLYKSFFTTKPVGHGTGLGMSITRDIIENKHHGRIEFTSEENVQTTFSLIIPMKK